MSDNGFDEINENSNSSANYDYNPDENASYAPEPAVYTEAPTTQESGTIGFGVASLVLGIVSLVLCCCSRLSGVLGVLAVIFGIIHIAKHLPKKGLGIAGIITGAIGLIMGIVITVLSLSMINSIENGEMTDEKLFETMESIFGEEFADAFEQEWENQYGESSPFDNLDSYDDESL